MSAQPGKAIVITGGGAGLGLAMARRLAADGHRLFLLGRNMARLEEAAASVGGHAVACDVADPASVEAAFDAVAAITPRIDVLINNAGVFAPSSWRKRRTRRLPRRSAPTLPGRCFVRARR